MHLMIMVIRVDTQLTIFLSSSYKEVPTVSSKIKLILHLFKESIFTNKASRSVTWSQ